MDSMPDTISVVATSPRPMFDFLVDLVAVTTPLI